MQCEECKEYNSCNYLQHRFGVKKCNSNRKEIIEDKHKEELRNREKLINCNKTSN